MKINVSSLLPMLDAAGVPMEDRSYFTSLALARAIGYWLAMPSAPVDNPYVYFQEQHQAAVELMIGEVNERIVVDFASTVDLVAKVWVARYRICFEAFNSSVRDFLDTMLKIGNRDVPARASAVLNKFEASEFLDHFVDSFLASLKTADASAQGA